MFHVLFYYVVSLIHDMLDPFYTFLKGAFDARLSGFGAIYTRGTESMNVFRSDG